MWVEHGGKGAPNLPPGTLVRVRLRDEWESSFPTPFEEWDWTHFGGILEDIIAYKVVSP